MNDSSSPKPKAPPYEEVSHTMAQQPYPMNQLYPQPSQMPPVCVQPPPSYAGSQMHQPIHQQFHQLPPTVTILPSQRHCSSCGVLLRTRVEYHSTTKTHLLFMLCCLICFPVAPCVYCMDTCREPLPHCTNCGELVL